MTIKPNEGDVLCPAGFNAAIEAAQAAEHAGDDEQGQLAAGIVAYCVYMTQTKLTPLVARRDDGSTPATLIGMEHAAR